MSDASRWSEGHVRLRNPTYRVAGSSLMEEGESNNGKDRQGAVMREIFRALDRAGMRLSWGKRKPYRQRGAGDLFAWIGWSVRKLFGEKAPSPRTLSFPGHEYAAWKTSESKGAQASARAHAKRLQETYSTWRLRVDPYAYDDNRVCNQRYTILTFLPLTLINQFKHFFNVFYLAVGLSQLAPQFQIGPLFTYLAPLAFVVTLSVAKEALDDIKRARRDREINNQVYEIVAPYMLESEGCQLLDKSGSDGERRDSEGIHGVEVDRKSARDFRMVGRESGHDSNLLISSLPAKSIGVGQILRLHAGQRVPCDCILLRTLTGDLTTFIRTDQLDGETDWKMRRSISILQGERLETMFEMDARIEVEAPRKEIYDFNGMFIVRRSPIGHSSGSETDVKGEVRSEAGGKVRSQLEENDPDWAGGVVKEALSLENTLWANTFITNGPILALSISTGRYTRFSMHSSSPRSKLSKFDMDVNHMSKLLCSILLVFALFLTIAKPISPLSPIYFVRFVLLLSSIIPISLRVNLDMAKILYSFQIAHDKDLPQCIVRNSTLPEELGRLDALFSDKTGTLTKNIMSLNRIAVGGRTYALESASTLAALRKTFYSTLGTSLQNQNFPGEVVSLLDPQENDISQHPAIFSLFGDFGRSGRLPLNDSVRSMIASIALCHSVTLAYDESTGQMEYQASSPDEMALVGFGARQLGVRLSSRTPTIKGEEMIIEVAVPLAQDACKRINLTEESPYLVKKFLKFKVLEIFPFTSARKRMGLILQEDSSQRILYIVKGADTAILPNLAHRPQWMMEELESFSRAGLRTLVFAWNELSPMRYKDFQQSFMEASSSLVDREARCNAAIEAHLEAASELLGVTGVEDELQNGVAETVESIGQAGIKIWVLTGDKVETALCIAASAGLRGRMDTVLMITSDMYRNPIDVITAIKNLPTLEPPSHAFPSRTGFVGGNPLESRDLVMLAHTSGGGVVICIDGTIAELILSRPNDLGAEFVLKARYAHTVLCCRCSPSQKAQLVGLVQNVLPDWRVAAIGDGGNDVPMIQKAHCGIGVVGKEGKQASLASDFSITEFQHLKKLLLWHGRLAHQRSSKLCGFVVHRGLLISAIQIIFSAIFYYVPLALFQGWLQVGYSTYYTMLPVFSLVLDRDIPCSITFLFPELYEIQKTEGGISRDKVLFKILFKSIYQGVIIMLLTLELFEREMSGLVAITFTSLILAEYLNIISEIVKWHILMFLAIILSIAIYAASLWFLPEYFDINFISTADFWEKVGIITLASWLPVHIYKVIKRTLHPPRYAKLLPS